MTTVHVHNVLLQPIPMQRNFVINIFDDEKQKNNTCLFIDFLYLQSEMNAVLGHDSALARLYTVSESTWTNEMNLVMNHAPGAGSIARPGDQQSSTLPLYPFLYLQLV